MKDTPELFSPEWFREMAIQGLEGAEDLPSFIQGLSSKSLPADKKKTAEILRQAGYLTEAESARQVREALKQERRKPGPPKTDAQNSTLTDQRLRLDRIKDLLLSAYVPASSKKDEAKQKPANPPAPPDFAASSKKDEAKLDKSPPTDIYKTVEVAFVVVRRFYLMCTLGAFFTQKDQRSLLGPEFVAAPVSLDDADREYWDAAKALPTSGVDYTRSKFIRKCLADYHSEPGLDSDQRIKELKPKLDAFFGCKFKSQNAALETLEEHLRHCLGVVDAASYVNVDDLSKVYPWAGRIEEFEEYIENAADGRSPPPPETCPCRKAVKALFETIRLRQKLVFPTTVELFDAWVYPEETRLELIQHHLNVPLERRKAAST